VSASPAVSILLPTDSLATVRAVLAAFASQAGIEQAELVLAVPCASGVSGAEPELRCFCSVRVVEVDEAWNVPAARAAALRAAGAPVVVFAETHAYPRPGYLRALLAAHEQGWTVVGPAIANANPASLVSWALLYLDYGRWVEPVRPGAYDDVPGHNAAYKRAALLALGASLDGLMPADNLMHRELRARGHRLAMEPEAVVDHVNVSSFKPALRERFHAGRVFAMFRARDWPPYRRLAYTLGSPAIPLVRLSRTLSNMRRTGRSRQLLPRILPVLTAALLASAAGEAIGYTLRRPGDRRTLYNMELRKLDYLDARDRLAERLQP
jgi:hypothetical protein